MRILGRVGIDTKLLIAQMVNFGLLVWFLKRFLYAPIIQRIETDERRLREAKQAREKLERERKQFLTRKTSELAGARQRAQEIIARAHTLAQKIEAQARRRAEAEEKAVFAQWEKHLQTLESTRQRQLKQAARREVLRKLRDCFLNLPSPVQAGLEKFFWQELLKEVKKADFTHLKSWEMLALLKEAKQRRARGKVKKADADQDLVEEVTHILSQRLGPLVLEHAREMERSDLIDLQTLLSRKIGVKVVLTERLNPDLMSGFRLEVAGLSIESSLRAWMNI